MPFLGASKVRSKQDLWGLLFEGDLKINRKVDGVWQGLKGPYNNTKFALLPQDPSVVARKGRMRGNTQNQSVKKTPTPTQLGFAFDDAGKAAFEMALRSQASAFSQVAGTASSEPIVIDKLGSWYVLPHQMLTAAPTFTGSGGVPALVVGDAAGNDIGSEVDLEFGEFYVNDDASQIAVPATIEANYGYGNITDGHEMDGDQVAENIVWVEFTGLNETEGVYMKVIARNVNVSTSSELDMKTEDQYAVFDFIGDMSKADNGDEAYSLKWWRAAA